LKTRFGAAIRGILPYIFCVLIIFHKKFNPFDAAREIGDQGVGKIADFGTLVLPEGSMREGCRSVGLYNKEKDGGPLHPKPSHSAGCETI